MKFSERWNVSKSNGLVLVSQPISNKPFDIGADPDQDPDPEYYRLQLRFLRDQLAALAEMCGLRVLLV